MLFSLIFATIGCIKNTTTTPKNSTTNYPDWFLNADLTKGALCGSAVRPIINGDLGNAKNYAEDEARDDLSRQIETKTGSMIKQYNQQVENGKPEEAISESVRSKVSKSLTKLTLNGSVPKKRDVVDNKLYVLVCLEPGNLATLFDQMAEMSEKQKAALINQADRADKDLDDALENYDER